MKSGTVSNQPPASERQHYDCKIDDYAVIEWPDGQTLRLDLKGRWCTFQSGSALYRRTLGGEVVARQGTGYRSLGRGEHSRLLDAIHEKLKRFIDENSITGLSMAEEEQEQLRQVIERSLKLTLEEYQKDARSFRGIYPEAVPILPPDRYRDIVVQPATGCPYGKCNFCMFYKDQRFHILGQAEFRDQLTRIKEFMGPSIQSRDGVFLGSASALSIPQNKLIPFLEMISKEFSFAKRGISAFMDPHHMPKRGVDEYKHLATRGLRQVVIGLESGAPALRKELGKSDKLDELTGTIAQLKEAGLQLGLTVLVGAGGAVWAPTHLQKTAGYIRNLPLDSGDIVYLSPLVEGNRKRVPEKEVKRFRKELKVLTQARLVPYRIHYFRYFS